MINVLIPAKGVSKRVPMKNLQILENKTLLEWCIEKCQKWIPDCRVYVGTEDEQIKSISKQYGCEIYPITDEDIHDKRTATLLFKEFVYQFPSDINCLTAITSPFTFKKYFDAALASDKDFIHTAYIGKVPTLESYKNNFNAITQNFEDTIVLTSNFICCKKPVDVIAQKQLKENYMHIDWISAIDINYPEDLELCRWLAKNLDIKDFE